MEIAIINDKMLPLNQIDPAYLDRGTFFGDGVYEVVRSYYGRLFALDEHLARFDRSLHEIGINNVKISDIKHQILKAFDAASIENAKVYFHITRGSELRSHAPGKHTKPNFFLTVNNIPDYKHEKEHGIAVSTHPDWRWKRCDIKSLNLLPNILARIDAEKKGCQEAIFIDDNGLITEGAGSAFFMIITEEKKLLTRPLGPELLGSISRGVVLQIAQRAGLTVLEKAIKPWHADWADELFIAVTTKDIVPVVKFDGEKIGNGRPGKYTKLLIEEFAREVEKRCKSE